LWGIGQPFAGGVADRFGAKRVMMVGAALYAIGLALMAHATTPGTLDLTAGVMIGLGLSGCSFNLVIGAFGKLLPESWRSLAFGAGTAAGSFGQFLYSPIGVALMDKFGWQTALTIFAGVTMLILPLAIVLATPRNSAASASVAMPPQSFRQAMAEAFGHRSYVLLVLGFFTCGFQLAFVTVHLPSYLIDRGLSAQIGGWTLATIGLFNIVGSLASGYLGNRMPKRYLLSIIYFARAVSIVAFISLPASPVTRLSSAPSPACSGCPRCRRRRRWWRSCSARAGWPCCSALRSSAIRSAVFSACCWAATCSTISGLTTRCGGCRCFSA